MLSASQLKISRRNFLKGAATTIVSVPFIVPSSVLGVAGATAPGNRLVMGCIGVGGMGTGNMRSFLGYDDVQVVAVCDVDSEHREYAKKIVEDHYAGRRGKGTYRGCRR